MIKKYVSLLIPFLFDFTMLHAQSLISKPISPGIFGIFFEDISYAADGGLYAELIQNRSFEYNPGDKDAWAQNRRSWDAFTAWEFATKGYGYGNISLETTSPLNNNNPHYLVINVEEPGNDGVGITNYGFDGIAIKQGEQYDFSAFIKNLSGNTLSFEIKLLGKKGDTLALQSFSTDSSGWKKYTATFTPSAGDDSSNFTILCKTKGKFAIDMVSLFPQNTFHNELNGLRADIAQTIADLHPKFIRFPGGCLVHGDGLGNMYRWKNTIGPVEERVEQKNIWNYHQTVGLGFYEYFRFCEDISAKPLPIVAAAVSCQNSGGTWRVGGIGQKAIPLNEMPQYIQDVLDLIEYANGPATSKWGAKRAAAGHPEPFHLQYIGVGNEDKQTDDFRERFKLIYDAVKAVYPDITVVGTAGPFYKGEDFEIGWQFAGKLNVPVVDEHYYEKPEWFLGNQHRYDNYDRKKSKVYVGEFASLGNTLFNALAEAAYMISLERNGDVVVMSSYAPLLANKNHASWSPDLIFFNNTTVVPTVNYYVQQLFSVNAGDHYYSNVISFNQNDSLLAASCVTNANEDIILKIVNAGSSPCKASINLKNFKSVRKAADGIMLTGKPGEQNTFQDPAVVTPKNFKMDVNKSFTYDVAAYSFTVIRIKN
jgi:alpha-L-arabinofuranosidase